MVSRVWSPKSSTGFSHRPAAGKRPNCHCSGGSGVTGVKADWEAGGAAEPEAGERRGEGTSRDPPGLPEAESNLVLAAMAQDVLKHAEKRGRGSVPAGVLRWAEEFSQAPPIDWRAMIEARIRYAMDSKKGAAPSYARLSRRSSPGGLVLPVHRAPIPRITIVADTSGSMDEEDIGKILGVVWDACETLGGVTSSPAMRLPGRPSNIDTSTIYGSTSAEGVGRTWSKASALRPRARRTRSWS